jgi:hypothetical protein
MTQRAIWSVAARKLDGFQNLQQVLDLFSEDSWPISNDVGYVKTHVLRIGRRRRLSIAKESAEAAVALSPQFSMSTLYARSVSLHHDGVFAPNISSVTSGP